ncbi:alpha/beta hydrolase [Actinomadura rubrisoli]|uniref:Alpha/beta hydrolase n=1 Tax=Actinomadura rubrisoli TaxID=2530368 RepID=A0A4R5BCM1_9ACTN|nr:alpha/beta hydrolase [Actinomadura rubrisoli]TDD81514.1 alpha/beta hydrolase [Actinomadura rubrisoli]
MSPTFVLVHGSNGNARSWAGIQRELVLRGHRSLAVDLPGHGAGAGLSASYQAPQDLAAFAAEPSPLADVTHADWVEHVIGVVRRAREHGPVILVGHSRGGVVVTPVANAIPDLLERTVYIAAWCCVDSTAEEYMRGPEWATSALHLTKTQGFVAADPAELGVLRFNWRLADAGLLAALKEALLADGTDQQFFAMLNGFEPDEILDFGTDRADADTWGRVPHTYVRLTKDLSMPLTLQDRLIKEADALTPASPFEVHSLDTSHGGIGLRARELADILHDSARRAVA